MLDCEYMSGLGEWWAALGTRQRVEMDTGAPGNGSRSRDLRKAGGPVTSSFLSETGYYVFQAVLELVRKADFEPLTLLLLPPKCWDYRYNPPCFNQRFCAQ